VRAERAIGIDVGGTKTHLRIERGSQRLIDEVIPTALWWSPGSPIEAAGNAAALMRACGDTTASALVVGAHGIDSVRQADAMATELRRLVDGPVQVLNDAALVGPAAGYLGQVITVISGTGSIVLARDARGEEVRLGGHGYLLGDEGAAPALVRDLARELLRGLDRGHHDPLALQALMDAAGVAPSAEPEEDLAAALHQRNSITDWGRLAPAVFAAADGGSPLACAVIERHAAELVALVELLLARGAAPEAVVLAGGVVTAQPRMADAIRAGIHSGHPDLPVVLLARPPVEGAVLLARQALDHPDSPTSAPSPAEPQQPLAQVPAPNEGSRS
jgi:N-acetylglucosamine kinase-like BadF-type ATPase